MEVLLKAKSQSLRAMELKSSFGIGRISKIPEVQVKVSHRSGKEVAGSGTMEGKGPGVKELRSL